jgi:UDP-glucose 4-epimerase
MTGTVLVTGASGFIGRTLVPALAAAGWMVRAAARETAAVATGERVSGIAIGDLSAPFEWRPLLSGVSHIVHLAGIAHASRQIPEATYAKVNAAAVRSLAEAARKAGIHRFLLVSSVRAQTGASAPDILNEMAPPRPTDAYGRTKLLGEQWLAETLADSRTEWMVLRPVLVYGRGARGNMHTLERIARLPMPLPLGAFPGRRSLLGLPGLVSAVLHGLSSPSVAGRTFLVADRGPVTLPEIVAALRRGLGRNPGIFALPLTPLAAIAKLAGRSSQWERVTGDLIVDTAALEATGWRPVETAAEGLTRWMRETRQAQA